MNSSNPAPLHISSEEEKYKLTEKLKAIDIEKKEQIAFEDAKDLNVPYINLKGFPISPIILGIVDENDAKNGQAICFYKTDTQIRLGVTDLNNPAIQNIITSLQKKFKGIHITLYLISQHSFEQGMKLYKAVSRPMKIVTDVVISPDDLKRFQEQLKSFEALQKALDETTNMTEIFAMLVASAMNSSSSDIHIEAEEQDVMVRFRIDGSLHEVAKLPKDEWPRIISRIKVIAGLKININSIPQDGRITIALEKDKMDIRVSTLPSAYGESVVMRLLKSSAASLEFEQLGVRGKAEKDLRAEIERPNGMIITTGPTGSGKTTTLYAVLNKLNEPEVKIITLEDPVEYKLKGITQSQIDHSKGYTFAKGLRAILRQDPDIVMVGEIRDLETAEIAVQAALTGHLVISTIHTNDAAGAIPRFLSMGVKPFLLAPAINAVIGQRLVRKICEHCKTEITLEPETLEKVKKIISEIPESSGEKIPDAQSFKFYKGKGCDQCTNIGLKGRIGIYEIFAMNEEIEKIVLSGSVSEYQMKDVATKFGMISMAQDGLLKALDGITTVEEVLRVAE